MDQLGRACLWVGVGTSAQGICALCYMYNSFGVVVFQRSMLNWRRGQGQSVMKLMQCSGLPEIYAQLEEGGPSAKYEHNVQPDIYETYLV